MDVRNDPRVERSGDKPLTRAEQMPLPRRIFVGAGLAGLAVAGLVALGVAGSAVAPQSETFRFTRGTEWAPGEEARLRGHLAALAANPDRLIRIVGHTGVQGDAEANQELSQSRALLALEIALETGLPEDRILSTTGVGGGAPLAQAQGITDREWERSLSRVTISDQAAP